MNGALSRRRAITRVRLWPAGVRCTRTERQSRTFLAHGRQTCPRQAVVRELWEETLIRCDPAALRGPVQREVVEFAWAEYDIVQHQAYYVAEVADVTVSFARMEAIETATTLAYRWWSPDALSARTEYVLPNVVTAIHAAFTLRN